MSQPLDIKTFPLKGSRLIEASAGTGKTYTIALLYVRLVLKHGDENAFGRSLVPPEILVVTFTEAASQELSDRIRSRLAEAARAFADAEFRKNVDKELQDLMADYPPEQYATCAMTLQRAAEWMDEAAVSTIHSWCYRMLREHAFDSRHLFTQELVTNQDELLQEVVEDYWRQQFYKLPENMAGVISDSFSSPQKLLKVIKPLVSSAEYTPVFQGERIVFTEALQQLQNWIQARHALIAAIKDAWLAAGGQVEAILLDRKDDLNKTRHGNMEKILPGITEWIHSDSFTVPSYLSGWVQDNFQLVSKAKNQTQPQHKVFELIAGFSTCSLAMEEKLLAALKCHAAHWIRVELEKRLESRAELGFDDMLIRLQQALHSDSGARLAEAIRKQFPVALIDEFQDTDPVQYSIFNAIYNVKNNDPDSDTALVMIGDPKQAIYAFRGADIYTYLEARSATEGRHYTLGKNFRSTVAMVEAVNTLFAHAETHPRGAFRFKANDKNPVPFEPVACNGHKEQLQINGEVQPALTGWLLPGTNKHSITGPGQYRAAMARVAASEIVRWLELAKIGKAGFAENNGEAFRPLQPKDIAVLVRTGAEARAIRYALTDSGVASVYLSDRDSVFASAEAPDVLRWLRAVAEPDNARLLKPALASAGLALSLSQLAQLFESENAWENAVLRFRDYRSLWQKQGVLPMLRRLLTDYAVAGRLLQQDNGERALTNVLHIAEWLQQQSQTVDGEQALIRLLADKIANPSEEDVLRLESDADLVKVITIHKSKGLEYPLVLLPFVCAHKKQSGDVVTYHQYDEKNAEYFVLTELSGKADAQADDERLSEDMRLLYVALTRARHALWLGVTPLGDAKNKTGTNLEHSAFGYLAQGGKNIVSSAMAECLPTDVVAWQTLPTFSDLMDQTPEKYTPPADDTPLAPARQMPRKPAAERWWVASYSALTDKLQAQTGDAQILPEPEDSRQSTADEEAEAEGTHSSQFVAPMGDALSMHQFPRGPNPGTFLHSLMEWAATEGFANALQEDTARRDYIAQCCNKRYWEKWIEPLDVWLKALMDVVLPVGEKQIRLAEVSRCLPEMEFWFESRFVNSVVLNTLVQQHTLAGVERPQLPNNLLNGMLKGFIDLVFEYDGQYYVADWKSNWLGDNADAYTAEAMRDAILHKRYELQYTLYILALHRHLQDRLPDYDYDQHIGGAVYVFLRGIHNGSTRGVHFEKPPRTLIEQLDSLFAHGSKECAA